MLSCCLVCLGINSICSVNARMMHWPSYTSPPTTTQKKKKKIDCTCSVISHRGYCSTEVLIISGRVQQIPHQGCFPTLIFVKLGRRSAPCGDNVTTITNQIFFVWIHFWRRIVSMLAREGGWGKLFVSGLFARATCSVDGKLWPRSGDFPSLRRRNWTLFESNWSLSVAQLSHFGPFFFFPALRSDFSTITISHWPCPCQDTILAPDKLWKSPLGSQTVNVYAITKWFYLLFFSVLCACFKWQCIHLSKQIRLFFMHFVLFFMGRPHTHSQERNRLSGQNKEVQQFTKE